MAEQFDNVKLTDIIRDSLQKLLNRDLTALTFSAGTDFPSDVNDDMIGRLVNRTDLNSIYRLKTANPVQWELVLDYSSTILNATQIAAAYQPKNSNLTALSSLSGTANQVPYFTSSNTMSTFPITSFGQSVLNCANAAAVRTLYGLGSLATKDTVGTSDIQNGSITTAKLAFTPIQQGEGFMTGDIKESKDSSSQIANGWISCEGTIGDASSEADYANANAENLFKVLWTNPDTEVEPNRGSSAQTDWEDHKRILLPDVSEYSLAYDVYIRIKL